MALAAGARLGPYEIVSLLGAGGMGEVYRARDPRLGREVAIKILPAHFSSDSDRLRRFEQEARASGILNHPNLLSVFDIGTDDGIVYVVSELLQGETLRERLGGVPLPVRKAAEYALQIAHGLAAAHERGIVHRDLKPENLFITRDGRVKILDFGLAKLMEPPTSTHEQSKLPTREAGTQPGIVLGTVGYMSPEQVRAQPTDHRSDIFTFGAIFYEMLTGKRAFQRESTADTMSAILKEDPPELSGTNQNVPAALERLIRHCLEKNPEERFQSARDLAFDLEMISGITESGLKTVPIPTHRPWRKILTGIAAIAALVVAFYAGHLWQKPAVESQKQTAPTFKRLTFRRGAITGAKFTPDGQSVVYSAAWGGEPDEIFITRPQSPVSRALELKNSILLSISTSGEMAILLKPEYLAGWARSGTLARVPIDGGAPREILRDVQDADWSPDGKSLAVIRSGLGSYRIEFPIGKVLYKTNGWMSHPRISPDAKKIAFLMHLSGGGDDRGVVAVLDLNGKMTTLTPEYASESGLDWSPDGTEIWYTASTEGSNEQPLYAVNLQKQVRIISAMVGNLILHDVLPNGDTLVARDSRRREVYGLPPGATSERDFSWFDWTFSRDLSEDGKVMIFEEQGAGGGAKYSVFIRKTDGSQAVRLGDGMARALSYDLNYVLAQLPGDTSHFTVLPAGAGENRLITLQNFSTTGDRLRWFRDAKRILLAGSRDGRPQRWWIFDLTSNSLTPVTPEGVFGRSCLSYDEQFLLAQKVNEPFVLYPVAGGQPIPVPNLKPNEVPIRWSTEKNIVFITTTYPGRIEKFDVMTGQRTFWKEVSPPDRAGISGGYWVNITPDGKWYTYTFRRVLSDLYLAKGLL